MKLKPTYFLLILLAAIAAATAGCSHSAAVETPDYIARLDSLIDHSPDFERNKLMRLAELTQKRKNAVSTTDKYMLNSILFDEYHTYKSDSAIKYIDANIELALQAGNKDWLTESKIKKSEFLTGTGLLADAQNLMESIDRQDIAPELLPAYYGNMIYLYSHLGNYTGGSVNEYYIKERAYKDSVMSVITPDHPEYLWYKGWDILGTAKPEEETIKSLKEKLSASNLNTHQDAKDAYILAKLYEQAGDRENYLRYMATSAAVDVKIANSSEISSLEDLSRIMFGKGDGNIDRAYRYINYCLNKAISYPNRVKAYGISSALDAISRGYEQRNIRHQQRIRNFLVLACVLAAILTAAIVIIIVQNGRLRRQGRDLDATNKTLGDNIRNLNETHQQLNEANTQLKQLIADLQQKNDELNEANFVKEEYICNIFTICSNYIDKLSELK
ncbi:MAG: transcriptional regulator, partial [Muribaculaceae bacterium]|nr:transcriptional regulator [Muribaculaceae bacterium]